MSLRPEPDGARAGEPKPPESARGGPAALAERYLAVRRFTESLAMPLAAEDCVVQSMPDASPVAWHLAHTTWFFETFVLARAEPEAPPFSEAFAYLYNSYYESAGPRHARAERGLLAIWKSRLARGI